MKTNMFRALAALICGFSAVAARPAAAPPPHRVIIDTDPGTDDALAILLALNSPEIRVEALTIVAGNQTAPKGLENALKVVSLAGRCDLPVAKGGRATARLKANRGPILEWAKRARWRRITTLAVHG